MYEHPIKRAGLSFNRILFSNTNSVKMCFPDNNSVNKKVNRFDLSFMLRKFENGKEASRQGKNSLKTKSHFLFFVFCFLVYTSKDLDDVLPANVTKSNE